MIALRFAAIYLILIALVLTLVVGKALLVPFVFALFFWLMIKKINSFLLKFPYVKRNLPSWVLSIFSFLAIVGFVAVLINIVVVNIQTLAVSYTTYEANIDRLSIRLALGYGIDVSDFINDFYDSIDIGNLLGTVLNSLTDLLGDSLLVILYMVFIFLEEHFFRSKLAKIFPKKGQYQRINSFLLDVEATVSDYMVLKTAVSFLTGLLSYIALLFIGVDFPIFWAFLIFLFNFIPNVGSIVATVFPAVFALFQFGMLLPFFAVLVFVGTIQVVIGNFLEPRLMGNRLNISPLITILALSLWGAIWGIVGMLLSVPITVIIVIICAQFPQTQPIAILLSKTGEITTLHYTDLQEDPEPNQPT